MTSTYVAIDVETTGLDPERDSITEIGAVRFTADGRELETFSTLVNPGREIPYFIEKLTGVTNEAVLSAPPLADVAADLIRFAGGDPIVGQNVGFDLAHLRKAGLQFSARVIDTAELSRFLLPDRQPRGLMELANALGIEAGEHHRALPDARTAAAVFLELRRRTEQIPAPQRLQLARLVSIHDLALAEVIGGQAWNDQPAGEKQIPEIRPAPAYPTLTRREPLLPLDPSVIDAVFAAADRTFERFEQREEQRQMAEAVREAMSDGGHWLVEAGTGVGKSLAYLIPAALHALQNGARIVVSTNTINLQEQLLHKDVPALRKMLREAGVIADEGDLRVSLLKGRGNYLCMRRWVGSYAAGLGDPDFARLAATMLLWLPRTETGDRSELSLDRDEWLTWQRFSAQDADCLAKQNRYVREGNCFLLRARKAAESAHIIIVNHALLLADLASGGSAIPPFDQLIVDEAHNLEDQATQQFGASVSRRRLAEALDGLHRRGGRNEREGGVATLLRSLPEGALTFAGRAIEQAVAAAHRAASPFFDALGREAPRGDENRLLVTRSVRARDTWVEVENAWAALDCALREVSTQAGKAQKAVTAQKMVEENDVLADEIESAIRKVDDLRLALSDLLGPTGDDTIVWITRENDGGGTLNAAPLEVGPRLWEDLFARRRTVVATSATLSAAGSMEYPVQRLGFEAPNTLQLGSPYDYRSSTLLAAFTDIPEPNDPSYLDAVAEAIVELTRASQGRALALFTSHAAIRAVHNRVREMLDADGITVLAQEIDGTPRRLVELLRENPRTVLLGTQSFWEGVDIRGDTLSMLIIPRLPFAVPTDPVHRARSEQYDNPFAQYSLPSAILRFRQGFGRLIRDRSDRGVVAVLDRRIWEKQYGAKFANALPECTRARGDTGFVAAKAAAWLAR